MIALDLVAVSPRQEPEVFVASWPIELVATMSAPNYDGTAAKPRRFTRIAHLMVPDCRPGDTLEVLGTFQISNRLADIVEFSSCLVLTPDPSGVAGLADPVVLSGAAQPPNGHFMKRFPGFNVTPNQTSKFPYGGMHHAPAHVNCRYVVPGGVSGDQYVAIVAYAAGVSFDPANLVFVDAYCGDLSVRRSRL